MLFSVIVPTYHRNDQLRECLDQLRHSIQGLAPDLYEVIVSDDGRDSTAEVMIKEDYPGVQWIAGPRQGPASNRNHGAHNAQGKWLIFTDDDCIPSKDFLRGYKDGLEPDTLAYEGKTICSDGVHSPLYGSPTNLAGGCFWSCNIMIQKDLFLLLNGFDTGYTVACNEDSDLRERLKHIGHRIKFVPDAVVDHPARLMNLGNRAGKLHETEVRMWYLTGNTNARTINVKILRGIVSHNVRRVFKFRFGLDSFLSIVYAIAEFVYVCVHMSKWHNKYSTVFIGKTPPYKYPY